MAGRIFLSYRREDTAGFALALFGRLEQSFPAGSLFMDVEGGIGAGQDFVRVIEEQVSACDAMLALIGPDWLIVKDENGRPRLENPEDFVRIEVASALGFGKRVIPVLVQKTEMPRADALPEPLKALARCNAVGLTQERFRADAQGLIKALEDALAELEEARRRAATEAAAAAQKRAAEQAAKAEEAARAEKERARLDAMAGAGLSPEQIAKAEELANWEFIKASELSQEFRDHLARFPKGVSEPWARTRLEALVWAGLPRPIDMDALKGFLAEFPKGAHASEATAKLAELEAAECEKAWASASAAGTVATLEDFQRDWPNSKYADAARVRTETGLIRTFTGHSGSVDCVAFSPDGRSALSGSSDKTLKLWDVATAKEIRTFTGHSNQVRSVAFSPDGRSALSLDLDYYGGPPILKLFRSRSIKLWDVANGKEIRGFRKGRELRGLGGNQTSVAFSPDGRTALTGDFGKTVTLWDLANGSFREFELHDGPNMTVAFSPDGRSALSGTDKGTLNLWDVATGKEIHFFFPGHTNDVKSVTFSPDGRSGLSGSWDKTLKLWDVATGKELRTFAGHTDHVNSVAFSPEGGTVLSGSEDKTLKLWDVATGKEIRTFAGHTAAVTSVAFSPEGRSGLSGSWDKTLKLWDLT